MNTKRLFAFLLIGCVLIAAAPAMAVVEWTGYTRETDQVGGLIADGFYDGVFNYDYAGTFGLGSVKSYLELMRDAQQIGVDGSGNPLYEYVIVQYNQPKSGYNIKQFILGFDNDQIVNTYDVQGTHWTFADPKWARTPMEFYSNTMDTSGPRTTGIIPNWFATWDPNPAVPWAFDLPDGLLDTGEMFFSNHAFPGPLMDAGDTIELPTPAWGVEAPADEGMLFVYPENDGFDYGGPGWSWAWRIVTTERLVNGDITWSMEPSYPVDEEGVLIPGGEPIYSNATILGRFFPAFDPGDVDWDGDIDADDIDLMGDYIRTGIAPTTANYDLSDTGTSEGTDGNINVMDLDFLVRYLVETSAVDGLGDPIFGTQYGDFNLDGEIELGDLTRLGTYYGVGDTWAQGNANRWLDMDIELGDLTILGTYYGASNGGVDAIPEPMTMSLLAVGGLAIIRRRRS